MDSAAGQTIVLNYGVGNTAMTNTAGPALDGFLASAVGTIGSAAPAQFLVNFGANEFSVDFATWRAAWDMALDQIHTAMPNAHVWIMRPWKRGADADANTMAGWIADLVTDNASFVSEGLDERVWLKGSDDGATNTSDGTHYSAAGSGAIVPLYVTLLGY